MSKHKRDPGNSVHYYKAILKKLEPYKGKTLDEETFLDLVYDAGLTAFSHSINEMHKNSSYCYMD
jgi:hypothetical protein